MVSLCDGSLVVERELRPNCLAGEPSCIDLPAWEPRPPSRTNLRKQTGFPLDNLWRQGFLPPIKPLGASFSTQIFLLQNVFYISFLHNLNEKKNIYLRG